MVFPILEGQIKDTRSSSGGIPFTNIDNLTDSKIACNQSLSPFYSARPKQLNGLSQFTKDEEHVTMSAPYCHETAGKIFILTGEIEYLIGERLGGYMVQAWNSNILDSRQTIRLGKKERRSTQKA